MKNNYDLKISDEMIGLDEPKSWINWCLTIADDMIMAGKHDTDGKDVTGKLSGLSKSSSTAVKKIAKSSEKNKTVTV